MNGYFEKLRAWYEAGVYGKAQVRRFAEKGWITREEYERITKEEYNNEGTDSGNGV